MTTNFDKKNLSETDIRTKYITPAIERAGWNILTQVREEYPINIDALQWAIKPGVSRAFDPAKGQKSRDDWANSGYGLHMISEICRASGGWLTFVSNSNCLRIYSNNIQTVGTYFHGTALGIRVKTCNISSFNAVIDAARKKGEETAKSIKNSFKTASMPSRGLMKKD